MELKKLTLSLLLTAPAISHGDIINMTVANSDWNSSVWGSPPAPPAAGNDYVIVGDVGNGVLRMPANGTSSTFLGDSLTVLTGGHALLKSLDGTTVTINGFLSLEGGLLNLGPNSPSSATLDVTELRVSGTGSTIQSGFSGRTFTIDGTLTGDGDFLVFGNGGPREVIFTAINDYTGAISVTDDMGLGFSGVSYSFSNSLTLLNAGTLIVDEGQTLTFESGNLIDENGEVAVGTYSGASLDALGANYENKGGTIVVGPAGPVGLALTITPNASNQGNYDFKWESRDGKVYDLVSNITLDSTPDTWGVWGGNTNVPSGGTTTTLLNVPGGTDSTTRFFAVVEKE